MSGRVNQFRGNYRFLSNFFPSPVTDEDGITFPTAEHYYQARKVADPILYRSFADLSMSAGTAKKMGQHVTLRDGWEDMKIGVMKEILLRKFSPGTDLAKWLLATGDDVLTEGNNWHDNFWGDCVCEKCSEKTGHNWLGKLLMEIRTELRGNDDA